MKKLLTLLLMLSFNSFAQQMPKYLEGAEITVKLKNGKTHTFKSEEYAVIPRSSMGKTLALQNTISTIQKKIKNKEFIKNKNNRVFGLFGLGNTGSLDVSTNGSRYKVEHDRGTVVGIGYQRKMDENFNFGVVIQDNQTTSLSLGIDY